MYYVIAIIVASSLIVSTSSLPSKHTRRSAISFNNNRPQSEIPVGIPLREEQVITEREVGSHCINNTWAPMGLFKLEGRDAATCNDGSESGYYLLRQPESTKWVIYLEGGWYCANELTCKFRRIKDPQLTSSKNWNACKQSDGIFSVLQSNNPHLFDSNMVYIPYCSSDVWSGTARNRRLGDVKFSFMGSIIIEQVVMQLIENHGMRLASTLLLAGSSAGGTGVLMNIDRVKSILERESVAANVRGVVDSAWYLKRPAMDNDRQCRFPHGCSPVAMIKLGVPLWQPNIPEGCLRANRNGRYNSPNSARRFSRDGRWKCFFGPVVYPHLQAEVFIVQWLFDRVQLHSDNVNLMGYHQSSKRHLKYIEDLYEELKKSFNNVKGVFATSCLSHGVLDKSDWNTVTVSRVSLPDAIQCWEINLDTDDNQAQNSDADTSHSNIVNVQRRHHHNRAELYNNDVSEERSAEFPTELVPDDDDDYADGYYASNYLSDTPEPPVLEPAQCTQKAIDPCPLPQCNPTCPTFYNQNTRTFINAIDFLQLLGVDIRSMASQKGSNAAQLLEDLSDG